MNKDKKHWKKSERLAMLIREADRMNLSGVFFNEGDFNERCLKLWLFFWNEWLPENQSSPTYFDKELLNVLVSYGIPYGKIYQNLLDLKEKYKDE